MSARGCLITGISEDSWCGILRVQGEAYTDLPPEALTVLKSKWRASPETCFILQDEAKKVIGYLLAHSWNSHAPPKLYEALPVDSFGTILYLHDLAVSSRARGMGVGKQLFKKLLDTAKIHGFEKILLVAVQGSDDFWSSLGFRDIPNVPVCASYGSQAKLMCRHVQTQ